MTNTKVTYGTTDEGVFREALEFLQKKKVVTSKKYKKMEEWSRHRAFSVSGYTRLEVVKTFLTTLETAVQEGTTKEAFREQMNGYLVEKGYEGLNPVKANTIFVTNVQTAFNVGHYESMNDETVKKLRPYWQYQTAGDGDVRQTHQEMADKVYAADDPIWNIWYPPNGFNCRCIVTTLSKRQFEQRGYTLSTKPPHDVDLSTGELLFKFPDKGFSNNPAKADFKPDLSDYPKELQTIFKEREKQNPIKPNKVKK